jgi:hypothetical protein
MTSNWKAVLGVFLVFIFGCFAGGISTSLILHHKVMTMIRGGPAATVLAVENRLTRRLDLDADQKQKVDALFQENLQERMTLQAKIRPDIQMANLKTFQGVKAVLRLDQVEQFQRNIAQFRKNMGQGAFNTNGTDASPANLPVAGTPAATDGGAAPAPAK